MLALTEAALILLGGESNERCPGVERAGGPERCARDVTADILAARGRGAKLGVLVGGEPLVRRDVALLLRAVSRAGLAPGLATNGRMLVYPKVREALLGMGLRYARISLHGSAGATHDGIVGVAGAWEQTLEGIRALLGEAPESLRLDVASIVLGENVADLPALVRRVSALPRRASLCFRFVGPAHVDASLSRADASAVRRYVGEALGIAARAGADVLAAWEGFPPCLLEEHAHLRDESLRYGAWVLGGQDRGAAIPLEREGDRTHPFPCQDCLHEATCPGVPRGFLEHEGESVLRPTRSVRANSFNYEHVRDLPALHIEPGACEARDLSIRAGKARSLLLVHAGAVSLYESPTADFTDREVATVKDQLEQVYLDVSEGAALDDFTSSVRRVRPLEACRSCPDRSSCPGAFAVDDEPPFAREERWLRKEVSRLRGRVLDVGCGEQPYRDEIRDLVAQGLIEYHGLDPDEAALGRFRDCMAGGSLHCGAIEDFSWQPGYFDYVLVFRSINHFRDVEKAFHVLTTLMRVQAQMVLCDSPTFALLRSRRQVEYADQHAPVGHEHYRNWTSHQVVEFLRRFPLRVDVHRPVSAQTSNQWILKLMRTSSGGLEPEPGGGA